MLIIVKYGVYEDRSHIFIKERFNKMVIEDGKFYFIKDAFFEMFKNYGLMENKESGNSNKDVEIPTIVKDEIIKTSLRVVRLAESGTNIPFYNIIEMRNILLENRKG